MGIHKLDFFLKEDHPGHVSTDAHNYIVLNIKHFQANPMDRFTKKGRKIGGLSH